MSKKVAITGYYGTGSSAVWDLLTEYDCMTTGLPEGLAYEHIPFYIPHGLWDLESKLLWNNDIHRSDEALKSFRREMEKLAKNNFGWFGSYDVLVGEKFMEIVDDFILELGCVEAPGIYYAQYKGVKFSFIKCVLQFFAHVIQKRKIYVWGRQYIYEDNTGTSTICFPTKEEFNSAAKKFVKRYLELFEKADAEVVLFDHLLLPHNAYKIPDYFDEDFRLIIVERDVRDLYVLNKYIWKKLNTGNFFPTDAKQFVEFWKRFRGAEREIDDSRILRVNFESLIYEYDTTVEKIEKFIGIDSSHHTQCKKFFQPERSIKNTQVFGLESQWEDEIELIHRELGQFEYKFPYSVETDFKDMFDDSRA